MKAQQELFDPAAINPRKWGVCINENYLQFYGGAAFWLLHRPRWEASGQLTILKIGMFGDEVIIGPFTRDDAEFAHGHLLEHGAPAAALKIRDHDKAVAKATDRLANAT